MSSYDQSLEVSIPVKLLRLSMFDTPPATPLEKKADRVPDSNGASFTPRTPRKPLHPVKTIGTENSGRVATLSFKMCRSVEVSPSPLSLSISFAFNSRSRKRPGKARRRLFFTEVDRKHQHYSKYEKASKVKKLDNPYGRTLLHLKEDNCDFIEDADDEMDQIDLLSPPSTPIPKVHVHEEQPLPLKSIHYARPGKKTCLSCHTTKTPLWRDSEDGTPYCNACGIRYRKYRIRCPVCYCVPHKDELIASVCSICGLKFTSSKLKLHSR